MAKADGRTSLRTKAAVIAATDLPGVPEGTAGKVIIVNGLSWIRYWVRFDNGVTMGSVNRSAIDTPDEWRRRQSGEFDDTSKILGASGAGGDDGSADDGGGVSINGVMVPNRLLERSKAARARLAA